MSTNTSRTNMVLIEEIEVQVVFSWRRALIPAVESAVNLAGSRWIRRCTEMCRGAWSQTSKSASFQNGKIIEDSCGRLCLRHLEAFQTIILQGRAWNGTGVSFQRQTISTKHYKMFFSAIGVASGCFETFFIFHRFDFRGHRPGTVPGWNHVERWTILYTTFIQP